VIAEPCRPAAIIPPANATDLAHDLRERTANCVSATELGKHWNAARIGDTIVWDAILVRTSGDAVVVEETTVEGKGILRKRFPNATVEFSRAPRGTRANSTFTGPLAFCAQHVIETCEK